MLEEAERAPIACNNTVLFLTKKCMFVSNLAEGKYCLQVKNILASS